MTSVVDIANRALIASGIQKQITAVTQDSPEAQVFNTIYSNLRDQLLRAAPWDCGFNTINLAMISAVPGTPENQSPAVNTWQKGLPTPPWAYEYQYPVDCLRACWIVPQTMTGFASGVPITTAITGGAPAFWNGPPARFKVAVDQFFPVTAAVPATPGTLYAVGDLITLASGLSTSPPIGAPVVLQVATLSGSGVATVNVVNQIAGEATPMGGSYFAIQTNPVAQGSTTGSGTGATFNLTFGPQGDQRIVLTNQEQAALCYVKQIVDANVFDPLFQDALTQLVASRMIKVLTGDINAANAKIQEANAHIVEARKADGNEGMTVNNVTPDWIRIRGIYYPTDFGWTPNQNFDWGGMFPLY